MRLHGRLGGRRVYCSAMTSVRIETSGDGSDAAAGIQAAPDEAARGGGGTVRLGPGVHRSTGIRLPGGARLHLEAGCVLAALQDEAGFPVLDTIPGNPGHVRALVSAEQAGDVAITGPGAIAGWGAERVSWQQANAMSFRPALIYLRDCRDVRIEGVTLRDSVFWTCHLMRCRRVTIENVTIRNRWPNSDGIDPDGCADVTIRGCDIVAGDDCICLKSTHGDACERVTVRDCVLSTSCAALKLGTEALADIRDVAFERCTANVVGGGQGIAVYLKDGGSYRNVRFADIRIDAPASRFPVVVDVSPRDYRDAAGLGRIADVTFERVCIDSPGRVYVEGHPQSPVDRVRFVECVLRAVGPEPTGPAGKPVGSARGVLDPDRDRHTGLRGGFVLIHAPNASVVRCRLEGDVGAAAGEAPRPLVAMHEATCEST